MPFEPLRTDEKLSAPAKATRDMDSQMIAGCSGFGLVSLLTYALGIWPHFVFSQTYLVRTLLLAGLFGLLPATLLGLVGMRRFGLAAACGYIGGTMATAVFLFLRMKQAMVAKYSREAIVPEYPDSWVWVLPSALVLLSVLIAYVAVPRREFADPVEKDRKNP